MSQPPAGTPPPCTAPRKGNTWYYPSELVNDLKDVDISEDAKAELISHRIGSYAIYHPVLYQLGAISGYYTPPHNLLLRRVSWKDH